MIFRVNDAFRQHSRSNRLPPVIKLISIKEKLSMECQLIDARSRSRTGSMTGQAARLPGGTASLVMGRLRSGPTQAPAFLICINNVRQPVCTNRYAGHVEAVGVAAKMRKLRAPGRDDGQPRDRFGPGRLGTARVARPDGFSALSGLCR